jgi:hypothetical protein
MPFPRLNSEQEQNRIAELERQLASSEEIRHAEKAILIAEIEAHTETKRQLAEARKPALFFTSTERKG